MAMERRGRDLKLPQGVPTGTGSRVAPLGCAGLQLLDTCCHLHFRFANEGNNEGSSPSLVGMAAKVARAAAEAGALPNGEKALLQLVRRCQVCAPQSCDLPSLLLAKVLCGGCRRRTLPDNGTAMLWLPKLCQVRAVV